MINLIEKSTIVKTKKNLIIAVIYFYTISLPVNAISKNTKFHKENIQNYLNSVVTISSKISNKARTAKSLGIYRQGSGVIIDEKNILTIGYIIIEATEIIVGFKDKKKIPAKIVGYDHSSGFGLISPIIPYKLTPLKIGNSDHIQLDEPLLILPSLEIGPSSKVKIVSRRPFSGWWEYYLDNPIYTIPVNNYWTGSPLLNMEGDILGIGSLFITDSAYPGIVSPGNMFVPINLIKPILSDLIKYGKRINNIRPFIGLSSDESNGKIIVLRVSKDGPAEKAGIRKNDVILKINQIKVRSLDNFYKILWNAGNSGIYVSIEVLRKKKNLIFKVKTMDRVDYYVKNKSF